MNTHIITNKNQIRKVLCTTICPGARIRLQMFDYVYRISLTLDSNLDEVFVLLSDNRKCFYNFDKLVTYLENEFTALETIELELRNA